MSENVNVPYMHSKQKRLIERWFGLVSAGAFLMKIVCKSLLTTVQKISWPRTAASSSFQFLYLVTAWVLACIVCSKWVWSLQSYHSAGMCVLQCSAHCGTALDISACVRVLSLALRQRGSVGESSGLIRVWQHLNRHLITVWCFCWHHCQSNLIKQDVFLVRQINWGLQVKLSKILSRT